MFEPFEIEAGERQAGASKAGFGAAAIEAEDDAILSDRDVGIHAGAVFEEFVHGPRLAFIAADFDADVFAGAALAGLGFAFATTVEVVGVGEEDETLASVVVADDAGHANGLQQRFVELRCAPVRRPIGTGGGEAAMGLGFAAHVEHDATVVEFDNDGFVWIDPFVGAGHGDVASLPCLALIIAVNGGGDAGSVGIAAFTSGKPHRHDEAAGFELDAVIRAGGEHFPGVVFFEGVEGGSDLDWFGPGEAVVLTALVKGAFVFEAEEHVHHAILVGNEHRVIVGDLRGVHVFEAKSKGVLLLRSGHIGDALRLAPGFAVIGAAAEQDADVRPIATALACLTPGEHGAFGRHNDAGDVVDVVGGIVTDGEEVLLFDKGLGSMNRVQNKDGREEKSEFHRLS